MNVLVSGWELAEAPEAWSFSDRSKVKYDADLLAAVLRPVAGAVDTGSGNYVDFTARPAGGTAWTGLLGFEEDLAAPLPPGAVLDYRLGTGGVLRYWNGSAWTAATTLSHWSDALTVRAHLAAFPLAADGRVTLQARLRAGTDGRSGPALRAVRLAAACAAEQLDDLLTDGLTAYFGQVRGRALWAPKSTGGSTYALHGVPDLSTYRVTDVEAVYNLTTDPGARTNLRSAYDATTGTLTLTAAPAASHQVRVRLLYAPSVYRSRSQDLPLGDGNTKIPALSINEVRALDGTGLLPGYGDLVGNPETGTAWAVPPPRHGTYRGLLYLLTPSERELMVLGQRLLNLLDEQPLLRAPGTGESYPIRPVSELVTLQRVGITEVHAARLEFQLEHVQLYTRPAVVVPLLRTFTPRPVAG